MKKSLVQGTKTSPRIRVSPALVYSSIALIFLGTVCLIMFLLSTFRSENVLANEVSQENTVTHFEINMIGNPDSVFLSPKTTRTGKLNYAADNDNCIEFHISLDKNAEGIKFEIASGEIPSGSLYYYIDGQNPVAIGQSICLNGTHTISFCKPGNSENSYRITSFSKASFPKDISVRTGGPAVLLKTNGLLSSSVKWKSVSPGYEGQFNSLLSNSEGSMVSFLSSENCPHEIAYEISGIHLSACGATEMVTDTFRITVFSSMKINITPAQPLIPAGGVIEIHSGVSGGKGKYSFEWYDEKNQIVGHDSTLKVSEEGNYTVIVYDEMSATMSNATKMILVKQSNCKKPEGISVTDIKPSSVKISWTEQPNIYGYKIRKRLAGENAWSSSGTILPYTTRTLNTLVDNTPYQIQLQAIANPMTNDTSQWSEIISFTTKSYCSNPEELNVVSVGDTSANIQWSSADNAVNYKFRYRKQGDENWTIKNQSASFPCERKLKGLEPNTNYELQVLNECYWKSGTEFTKSIFFKTLDQKKFFEETEANKISKGEFNFQSNPGTGNFSFTLITNAEGKYHLEILNISGAKIYEEEVNAVSGIITKNLQLNNNLPNGIYFVRIRNSAKDYSTTVLISK